jgi:hypothetical protein
VAVARESAGQRAGVCVYVEHWPTLWTVGRYGGQIQQLLRRLDQQELGLRILNTSYDDNEAKLVRFAQVAAAATQRLNVVLEVASAWDVPPATYSHLHEKHGNSSFWTPVHAEVTSDSSSSEEDAPEVVGAMEMHRIDEGDEDNEGETEMLTALPTTGRTWQPRAPESRRQDSGFKRTKRGKNSDMELGGLDEEVLEEEEPDASEA